MDVERRAAFEIDGLVRVPDAVRGADVAAMRADLHALLATLPLVELAGALRPAPGTEPRLWEVGRGAAFAPLDAAVAAAVDAVFGPDVWAPVADQHGGLAAPNLPLPDAPWSVPHAAWHVDEPTDPMHARGWGLLGFAFLDEVGPGGGATVAIAGSPRRLHALAAQRDRGLLTTDDAIADLAAAEPWFAALFAPGSAAARRHFLDAPYRSAGIPLRVVELTGQPGELVLMDPRCLHTISANASQRARLTMRLTCARAG